MQIKLVELENKEIAEKDRTKSAISLRLELKKTTATKIL